MERTFEIGVIYRKNSRLYLATGEKTLLTVKNTKPQAIKPYLRNTFEVVRGISVEELCERWRITLDQMDEISLRVFSIPKPSKEHLLIPAMGRRDAKKLDGERNFRARLCRIAT